MPAPAEWLKFAPPPRPLTGSDKYHVFLSYRSVNRPWVLNLYDTLRELGYAVFLDQVRLKPGDRLIKELQAGLQASQSGVLVWSKKTADSDWVQREYETMETLASKKPGFQFVPLRLDDADLELFAANRIFLDFSSYPDGPNGGELIRLLHGLVGQPLSPDAARFASDQDEIAADELTKIRAAIDVGNAPRLKELFAAGGPSWRTSAVLAARAAEGLTKLGDNAGAIDILEKIGQQFPKAIRPQQLRALALARRGGDGDLEKAQEILGVLVQKGEKDPETLGIFARTWMDRYTKSGDTAQLKRSRDLYAEAFEGAPDDYYTGINAAAKSVFLGTPADLAKAAEYAARVQKIVGETPKANDYWWTATVGEVFLIRRMFDDAARLYEAAVSMAPSETGSHKSTWQQVCRLMEKLQPAPAERARIREPFSHLPDCATAAASKP
ncbi:MAG: hypothetical protein DMF85_03440 [Acidobacteria bacterium]|nr:MAG: hypothetical protein DMF85_03440 [Acidobacteriota bacterium]PYR79204.1 MAG: hypothetical protein DMF86_04155 [Acidobacteriota bacterium]